MYTVAVGAPKTSENCCLYSLNMQTYADAPVTVDPHNLIKNEKKKWWNYVCGVMANFPLKFPNFDVVYASNVPIGGGLSSSAALEVATFSFLEAISEDQSKIPVE